MKELNEKNKNKNTEPNRKLAAMGCITICFSLLLMNVGRLDGILPDWAVRISGIGLMICTAAMVFLVVRTFANYSKEKHSAEENSERNE